MLLNFRHAKVENRPKTYKRLTKSSFSVENQIRIAVAQAANAAYRSTLWYSAVGLARLGW